MAGTAQKARLQRRHNLRSRAEQLGDDTTIGRRCRGQAESGESGTGQGSRDDSYYNEQRESGSTQSKSHAVELWRGSWRCRDQAQRRRRRPRRIVSRSPDFTARKALELGGECVMQLASAPGSSTGLQAPGLLPSGAPSKRPFWHRGPVRSTSVAMPSPLPARLKRQRWASAISSVAFRTTRGLAAATAPGAHSYGLGSL